MVDYKVEWTDDARKRYENLMSQSRELNKEEHDFAYMMYKLEQYITYGEI
jgi:hypothetical protein